MTHRFTAHLRSLANPIWEAQHAHPFVRGIGDGTIDLDRFAFWVRQDYLFLIEYCRLFGLAAARAPDLATLTHFADLLQTTAMVEMALHRAYCGELGISEAALEREPMAPTTRGYTDFLLRVAALAEWCRELVDRLAVGVSAEHRRRMEEAFLTSSRSEYAFWEMAWRQEAWPI